MTRKPRVRSHLRAVQAVKRFLLARTVEAKLFRAAGMASHLNAALKENAELRAENVALREAAAREKAERKAFIATALQFARKK